jgi:hypothetical protein
MGRGRGGSFPEPDSGHAGTISTTVEVRRTSRNAMKPRIQCVLTLWKPDLFASGNAAGEADDADASGRIRGSRPGPFGTKDLELRALPSDRHRYIVELTTRIEKRSRDF